MRSKYPQGRYVAVDLPEDVAIITRHSSPHTSHRETAAMRPTSNVTQESSLQTRGRDWFSSLPLGTRAVFVLCCAIYALCVLLGYDAFGQVCMAPHWVLYNGRASQYCTAMHSGLLITSHCVNHARPFFHETQDLCERHCFCIPATPHVARYHTRANHQSACTFF